MFDRCFHIFIFLFFLCTISCAAGDDFDELIEPETEVTNSSSKEKGDSVKNNEERQLNILVIGNSLARDAFCYVPAIIQELCPNIIINMSIIYVSGKPLSTHWSFISTNKSNFTWDSYSTRNLKWHSESGKSANEIILSNIWDLTILQEGSVKARTYETTQPFVSNIIRFVQSFQPDVKLAYMIIPALPDGATSLVGITSDEIWEMNGCVSKRLLEEGIVQHIITCGTAIQNARKTLLDKYGDFGHLTYDGRHLQEGIPCIVDAYAATESIFKIIDINASIENSTMRVSAKWVKDINVLGRHGSVIEGNDYDYEIAKQCALKSVEKPFEIVINE